MIQSVLKKLNVNRVSSLMWILSVDPVTVDVLYVMKNIALDAFLHHFETKNSKKTEKQLSGTQHPKTGQNIQQRVVLFL